MTGKEVTPLTNFVAGAAAGGAQIVVGYPFDTIKGMVAAVCFQNGYAVQNPVTCGTCVRDLCS